MRVKVGYVIMLVVLCAYLAVQVVALRNELATLELYKTLDVCDTCVEAH